MPLPFNAQEVIAQLRLIVWSIRHGRTEKALLVIAGMLFVAGTWLLTSELIPASFKEPIHLIAYGLYKARQNILYTSAEINRLYSRSGKNYSLTLI
jgi:hypothetical protein